MILDLISQNPEFRKNLKLEFNLTRILVPVILLALLAIACWAGTNGAVNWQKKPLIVLKAESLFWGMCWFGFLFSIIWGAYLSAQSMIEEVRQKSWDFLRMSSLSPWNIMTGKLFGATSVVWLVSVCGAMPLTLFAVSIIIPAEFFHRPELLSLGILGVVLALWMLASHALAFWMGVQASLERKPKLNAFVGVLPVFLIGMVIGSMITDEIRTIMYRDATDSYPEWRFHDWYGMAFYRFDMMALTLSFVSFWLVVASYRTMRDVLMYKDSPWVWILFLVSTSAYLSGYMIDNYEIKSMSIGTMMIWPIIVSLVSLGATCLRECGNVVQYKTWAQAFTKKDWREVFRLTPLWVFSFTLFILATLIAIVDVMQDKPQDAGDAFLFLISTVAFMTRDILVFHMISWKRTIRRPGLGIIIYAIIAYGFVPYLADIVDDQALLYFYPSATGIIRPEMMIYWPLILGQIALAAYLFKPVWRNVFGANGSQAAK